MRIALIAPPWLPVPPPAYGGTEAVVDRLARGFVAAGHEVVLFATGDSTCPVPTAWALEACASGTIGDGLVETRHLIEAYDTVAGCDVIHDHTMLGPLHARHLATGPVVTTAHGEFTPGVLPLYRKLGSEIAIVAISHDQARRAQGVAVAKIIHHGLDLDAFPVGDGGEPLAFLGRMTPDKGVREAALVARATGVGLQIAAKCREPDEIAYFEAQVRPLLGGNIEYLGELGAADKVAMLAGARALINPIRWPEPFGLVMAEALACGTPVLAHPAGAAPEIVEDGRTGFLCADVTDMVAKVDRLGEIDRSACRAAAKERFSTERMVAEHLRLYAALLAAEPSVSARAEPGAA